MKTIRISAHARIQMTLRGAEEEEVVSAIQSGTREPAKRGKFLSKCRFDFGRPSPINQQVYKYKTVEVVFANEADEFVVVTVKVYYFNQEVK